MARPDPGAYREALLRSRALLQQFREEEARRILRAIRDYGEGMAQALRGLPADNQAAIRASLEANEQAAARMLEGLLQSTEQDRVGLFESTLQAWEESGRVAARSVGIDAATLGAVRAPPVTMLGAFESIGGAANWRTLLRGHVSDAATEANRIVRRGILEGVDRNELARDLRRYVEGSAELEDFFEDGRIDLRQSIPEELQGAARQMEFNARRIASTELRNASHEATLQHMIRDPLIGAVKWDLAPTHSDTDVCDVLASADHYGLGPGVYPVDRVPAPPHPFDACSNRSITRDSAEIRDPKPSPDRRNLTEGDVVQQVRPLRKLKRERASRIAQEADEAIRRGEEAMRQAREAAA